MADRLQKTLQAPTGISSQGNPIGPDTSTANAINAATQVAVGGVKIAEKFRLDSRKEDLQTGLDELGGEVDAIRRGEALTNTTERFKRLKKMNDQGLMTDSAVNIAAEVELKKAIGTTPGFGDALRGEAAKILGFDPTGSHTMSLFGKTGRNAPSRPLNARQKLLAESELLAEFTGMTTEAAAGLIQQTKANKLLAESAVATVQAGQAGVDHLTSSHLAAADGFIMDAMGSILTKIGEGGLTDPEALGSAINIKKQEMVSAIAKSAAEAGVTMNRVKVNAQVDAAFAGVTEMVASGTMQKIMERNVKELTAAASIIGFETFGHLAVMEAAGGQVMVKSYLEGLLNIQDEGQLALMAKIDPSLAAALGNKKLMADKWSAAWSKVMGVSLEGVNTEQSTPGMEDVVTQTMIRKEKDPESRDRLLEGLRQRGQKFKDFSQYAQQGARALSTPQEVGYITENWSIQKPALIARIGATLSERESISLQLVGGKLKPVVKPSFARAGEGVSVQVGLGAPSINTGVGTPFIIPAALQQDITRLNSMNGMVQNGWANDVGENPNSFLASTLNEINSLSADAAQGEPDGLAASVKAFEASPSLETLAAIRASDPELADAILESSARQSGGTPNGK